MNVAAPLRILVVEDHGMLRAQVVAQNPEDVRAVLLVLGQQV